MADVFISYSRRDIQFAQCLHHDLAVNGETQPSDRENVWVSNHPLEYSSNVALND